ncbi:hypothetical protein CDV31_003454 [Fusarium ambrosium]|uniref:Small EDRK-rich factor-like N-terminal domain-containing protein n=1 Tax=Fusarium ambrosium TaxID=131363 RepID=A0A428UTS3_9HYPO|nr:hypothetical protein CDV31_003454 [Fusarium ambrosium]
MARGNQREKSRQANLKEQAKKKNSNNLSGTQMQHAKEANADIMRQKQAAGTDPFTEPYETPSTRPQLPYNQWTNMFYLAEARKAAEGKK